MFLPSSFMSPTSENVGRIEVQCMMTVTFVLGRIADAPFPTSVTGIRSLRGRKKKAWIVWRDCEIEAPP